ncbi:hypothetical protein ERO13_D10G144800v2 [Gossypium hirsutum]|nr:hypothetical protein ERO13_D10G144800v2 [Gossypium hirsutum]TYH49984.1 hypothetical protein ES332_D10G173800v1 [Gossypium tomentosum]
MRKSFKDSPRLLKLIFILPIPYSKGFQFQIGIVSTKTTIFFYSLIALSVHQRFPFGFFSLFGVSFVLNENRIQRSNVFWLRAAHRVHFV